MALASEGERIGRPVNVCAGDESVNIHVKHAEDVQCVLSGSSLWSIVSKRNRLGNETAAYHLRASLDIHERMRDDMCYFQCLERSAVRPVKDLAIIVEGTLAMLRVAAPCFLLVELACHCAAVLVTDEAVPSKRRDART